MVHTAKKRVEGVPPSIALAADTTVQVQSIRTTRKRVEGGQATVSTRGDEPVPAVMPSKKKLAGVPCTIVLG
jgi:hypothetical protein